MKQTKEQFVGVTYDELLAENAKLWELGKQYELVIADYRAEVAKLRELLKAAYKCTNAGPSCLECRIVAGGCTLLSAMRDLGIEVPQ